MDRRLLADLANLGKRKPLLENPMSDRYLPRAFLGRGTDTDSVIRDMGIVGGDDKDVYESKKTLVKPVPCAICGQMIEARTAIRALDKHFHNHCFNCADCGKSITSQVFTMRDEKSLVCGFCGQMEETGTKKNNPLCKACQMPVAEGVKVQGHSFHRGCFKCSRCDRMPTGGRIALDKEGSVVCESCIKNKTPVPTSSSDNEVSDGGGGGALDDLEKLHELFKKGVLTKEEFDAKKKQILGL